MSIRYSVVLTYHNAGFLPIVCVVQCHAHGKRKVLLWRTDFRITYLFTKILIMTGADMMSRKDGFCVTGGCRMGAHSFVVIKVGLHHMPPLLLAGLRFYW